MFLYDLNVSSSGIYGVLEVAVYDKNPWNLALWQLTLCFLPALLPIVSAPHFRHSIVYRHPSALQVPFLSVPVPTPTVFYLLLPASTDPTVVVFHLRS